MKSLKGLLLTASLGVVFCQNSYATVFYQDDFENGIKYVGAANKHPGGGYIIFLGGEIAGGIRPGDGRQDFQRYTNVILDSSSDAANATAGSQNSLKTQYRAGYEFDYGLNTTIIQFPETNNVYIRWYQKWNKNWVWPSDQQKLAKVLGPEQSQNFKLSWGHNYINVTKKSPPPNDRLNETYVFADLGPIGEAVSDWRQNDSDPSTSNFALQKDRWYCIEIMVRSNTPGLNDAQLAYWIDDSMKFNLTNTNNRGTSTRGITTVELQHVLQNAGGLTNLIDQPTWMDNLVVSDQRVGCSAPVPTPKPPANVVVQ